MKITSVEVHKKNDETRMKGIASVVIDECFKVRDIRIIEGKEGLFIAMPSRKNAQGEYHDVAHPLNAETRKVFHDAIIEAYNNTEE